MTDPRPIAMTPATRPRAEAVPRLGPRWDHRALPMAGSAQVWFDEVVLHVPGVALRHPGNDGVDGEVLERLSAPRAALCGLALDRPRIMGILNVTPDSFSDGGALATVAAAVARAQAMRGADILDIGGESTRPGAETVPVAEEIRRTAPVIRAIRDAGIATPISIDTRKADVARAALEAGADIVNDVSALGHDPDMAGLVAECGVPVCLMHAQGAPATMQDDPRYADVLFDVLDGLAARVAVARAAGVARDRIVADPGIGFGKTLAHNLALLRRLALFHDLGVPLLVGASRKRFIGTLAGMDDPQARMPGSVAVALAAVAQGVHILRVHDVAETRQALDLWQAVTGDAG